MKSDDLKPDPLERARLGGSYDAARPSIRDPMRFSGPGTRTTRSRARSAMLSSPLQPYAAPILHRLWRCVPAGEPAVPGGGWLFIRGVGVWGINIPVGWGFAIVNFVWWIGIGHAGTLISAILLLLKQDWRTSINRFAEAMTLFAVAQAGHVPDPAPRAPVAVLLADAVSELDVVVAAAAQPADLGRVRGFHLRDCVVSVLVHGTDSRSCDACATAPQSVRAEDLRPALDGLARFGASLAALSDGVSAAGRFSDAAGCLGAHRCELRLCDQHHAGLAHDDFPALFRRGRNLLRIRDGADARDPVPRPGTGCRT